jgi:hypothetical protein
LGKAVRRQLRRDRKERIRKVSVEVEEKLENHDVIGAYALLHPWYKPFDGKASKPSVETLEKIRLNYATLFTKEDREGELPFEFQYHGREIDDEIPSDFELGVALRRMRSRKAPGMSGLNVDTLKQWFQGAYPERKDVQPDVVCVQNWAVVREIIVECFETGTAPTAFSLGTLIIIPKDDKGGVRGIGLLESIHKLISAVINLRMGATIEFCPAVHGFRKNRGCFTVVGEAKLRMQRAACKGQVTFQIFLDLRKAYDSIHRESVLALMKKSGVGPRILR